MKSSLLFSFQYFCLESRTEPILSLIPFFLPPNKFLVLVNGDQPKEPDEEDDEEELYELASIPNGETSNISSEAECDQGGQIDKSDSDEKEVNGCQSEDAFCHQKNVIEDIRFEFWPWRSLSKNRMVQ